MRRTLRIAIVIAFVGLSVAALTWHGGMAANDAAPIANNYCTATPPPKEKDKTDNYCFPGEQPRLVAAQNAYTARQNRNLIQWAVEQTLLITIAAVTYILVGLIPVKPPQ